MCIHVHVCVCVAVPNLVCECIKEKEEVAWPLFIQLANREMT